MYGHTEPNMSGKRDKWMRKWEEIGQIIQGKDFEEDDNHMHGKNQKIVMFVKTQHIYCRMPYF